MDTLVDTLCIALSEGHDDGYGTAYELFAYLLGRGAEIATIIGVIGIVVAVFTYRRTARDADKAEQTQLLHNSIEVIRLFTDSFMPQLPAYRNRVRAEYHTQQQQFITSGKAQNPDFTAASISVFSHKHIRQQAQLHAGANSLFNKLEQMCTYIRAELVIDDIIYPVIHAQFLDFIHTNAEALDYMTTPDSPFIGVHTTATHWQNRSQQDKLKRTRMQDSNG